MIDEFRERLKNRAATVGWYNKSGKLNARGRTGVIDCMVGAGIALGAAGMEAEARRMTMETFLASTGRVDEFLNPKQS